jgi:hypothetical protein
VTHERVVRLYKANGALEIVDRLDGRGDHELRWHFHLAPGVTAEQLGETIALSVHGRRWLLTVPSGLRATIGPAAYSPSYGVKVPCLAIDATTRTSVDGHREWAFAIRP